MFCIHCGKEIADNNKFCPNCGAQITPTVNESTAESVTQVADTQNTETPIKEDTEQSSVSNESSQSNEQLSDWQVSYQKNKMIGLVTYKRVHTDVTLTTTEISISKKAGRKKEEKKALLSEIQSIAYKKTYDFWDTLYTVIIAILAIGCLMFKNWGGAGGLGLLAAVCFFSGIGKEIAIQFQDGSFFHIPVKLQSEVDDFAAHVSQYAHREIPASLSTSQAKAGSTSKKKKFFLIGGVVAAALILFVAVDLGLSAKRSAEREKAIETVRTGYLGEYTDVTVDELVAYIFSFADGNDIVWDGGQTDDDVMIVEARATDMDGEPIQFQFKMMDDETFRFGGFTGIEDLNEAVKYLNTMCYMYYIEQIDWNDSDAYDAIVDKLDQFSCGAVLCGASASYSGDRENLYQSAFDMEELPATAANYIGLFDTTPLWDDYSVDLAGSWQDAWSQRCNMTITDEGNSYYSFDVTWASSAFEYDEWTFSGYYDEDSKTLLYSNGMWYIHGEPDYINGVDGDYINADFMEGIIWLDGETLYWDDWTSAELDMDFGSSNMRFEKLW